MIRKKSQTESTEHPSNEEFKVRLSVIIGGKLIESDLDEALHIPTVDKLNPVILANMMAENAALHARWNFLYNEAVYEYDINNTKLEVWIAKKSHEYRQSILNTQDKDGKPGKVTESMVDAALKADPEYESRNNDLAKSKKNMKHILALANGFGEKGEKVVSIASMMKWEAENLGGSGKVGQKYQHIKKSDENYTFDKSKNDGWPT